MSTHQDWVEARENRDSLARLTARALLNNRPAVAADYAARFAVEEARLDMIEKELDGE